MGPRGGARAIFLIAGVSIVTILAGLASLTAIPVHRSPVRIADAVEPGLPPDFDAIALEGHQEGAIYVATLTVEGVVGETGYDVMILGREPRSSLEPHVYGLEYQFGVETSYGIRASRHESRLTFYFPLSLLIANAYIVGLEAVTFAPQGEDFVKEGPRETLHVARLLVLPFDPTILRVASVAVAVALGVFEVRSWRMVHSPRQPR
jgi:hypothetical protein